MYVATIHNSKHHINYLHIKNHVSLCVGGSKKATEIQLQCIPKGRDTTAMYPGRVWHKPLIQSADIIEELVLYIRSRAYSFYLW